MLSYDTSSSFELYLLDHSTKADFMRVAHDVSLMPEVYGKDLSGMISEWMDYIGFTF